MSNDASFLIIFIHLHPVFERHIPILPPTLRQIQTFHHVNVMETISQSSIWNSSPVSDGRVTPIDLMRPPRIDPVAIELLDRKEKWKAITKYLNRRLFIIY